MDAEPQAAGAGMVGTSRPNRRSANASAKAGSSSSVSTGIGVEFVLEKLSLPSGVSSNIESDLKLRLSVYNAQLQSCASGAGLTSGAISGRILMNLDFAVQSQLAQSIHVRLSGSIVEDSTASLMVHCVESKVAGWSLPEIPDLGSVQATFEIR
jgi:hypothetical protein